MWEVEGSVSKGDVRRRREGNGRWAVFKRG